VLVSSLVQGNFPKYSDVIPKDCAMKATIDGRQFEHRIRQAALLTDEESRSVKLSFSEGRVTLTSRTPDAGEAEVVCPASYSGESIELGFTPSFLTDALKVVDAEQISFEMNANNKPALLRCGQDFLYALMPLDPG
jgi:DNA polymerase-3 subunit beta